MSDIKKKQLVFNFIEFLRTSAVDGTVKEDDKESLEVAVQCISEAFGVDSESADDRKAYSIEPATLVSLLDVFLRTKAKSNAAPAAPVSTPAPAATGPSENDKAQAESLKAEGNKLMGQKLYESAIEKYSDAIRLNPTPIYYSNRAAAWGGFGEHEKAVEDAEMALALDPNFVRAYSRLGHAQFSLDNFSEAVKAYESGLDLDPTNANMKAALATAKTKLAETQSNSVADREPSRGAGAGAGGMPDLSSLASMLGGGGGGGGGGGMPDLGALLNNPQMMAMAQQMMGNGGLERMMQNPALRDMAQNMQNGGGMPDLSSLANDPKMRDLASQFMGGGGAGRQ